MSKRGGSSGSVAGEGLSASASVPRSASPLGLGSLFQKPTKWFTRSASTRSNLSPTDTRQKTSKISAPTDPRPIGSQDQLSPNRSVLSLAMNRSTSQLALSIPPSSAASATSDLRATSAKKWSRSVDDLSKFAPTSPESPPDDHQRMRIGEYRARALPSSAGPGTVVFPTPALPSALTPDSAAGKKHGRSMSFGRHKEPALTTPNEPVPSLPPASRIPVRTQTTQLLNSLTPANARPSFERANSHASEKDKTSSAGSVTQGSAPAPGAGYNVRNFGFPFGMHKPAPPQIVLSAAPDVSVPLTPTTPTAASSRKAARRASQQIMHSGFLLRLDHPNQAHAQGKPYKAVLLGSKLQCYKPPSGTSAELRELFPNGIVQPDIEEQDEDDDDERSVNAAPTRPAARRKFWGRGRHPELVVEGENEIRGSLDGLVHEVVFGTMRMDRSRREAFASAVLLCLPSAISQREDFDESFMRYLGRALQSNEEGVDKVDEKGWVEWCVRTYASIYGLQGGWDEWIQKNNVTLEGGPTTGIGSPYTGAFSPRPKQEETFGTLLPGSGPNLHPNPNPAKLSVAVPVTALTPETIAEFSARPSKLGTTLERDRLGRDVFLRIPSATIAKSLRVLNQIFLALAYAQPESESSLRLSRFMHLSRGTDPASLFCGSDSAPHWLTRLVMTQVLSPDMVGHDLPGSETAASVSGGTSVIPEGVKVSRTHGRAAVLCKWIRLGELARVNGDECTWRAIQAAVCARAIARLERVFRRMSDEERDIVGAWAREDKTRGLGAGRCTPWEGDVRERIGREMERARVKGGEAWRVGPFTTVRGMVDSSEAAWGACKSGSLPLNDPDVEDVVGLVRYFRRHAEDEELVNRKHIADYNALSFAIEPRRNRHYAPHFFRNKPPQSSHPLAPLLFPELMPTITMVDRSSIIRGKKVSNTAYAAEGEMSQEHVKAVVARTKAFQSDVRPGKDIRLVGEDLGETTLTVFDGELVLKLMKEEPEKERVPMSTKRSTTMLRNVSRPVSLAEEDEESMTPGQSGVFVSPMATPSKLERKPSRTPSIRATPSSHLERKQSTVRSRRSSLPSISQRTSLVVGETSEEPPLRALVTSGSLEKLVDVLISGLEEVGMQTSSADDNGEISLREGRTRGVRVDHAEYCKIFWGVFRSFVTPMVLFEMIQKRYVNAANHKPFSNTSNFVRHSSRSDTDDDYTAEIIHVLTNWIIEGGGGQDLLDDTEFFDGMYKFLFHSDAPELGPLRDLFKRVTRRPALEVVPGPSGGATSTGFGSSAPSLDDIDPETLADNLDAIAAAAFKPVTLTDLVVALDLLETQSADRLGWYVVSDLTAATEDLSIQNIYTQLQEADTSPLINEMGPDKFVRNLPSSIRSVFRAHDIVRRWAIMNIVAPRLGVQVRQERIELFLQTIEVCRLRTADSKDIHQPSIRTFTETALGAALCSPESRLFVRAWQDVGVARGASIESLSTLLATPRVQNIRSSRRMTADMGWLIECMLELLSLPDKSCTGESGVELVNFDKRRYLFNLISNAPNLQPLRRQQLRSNTHRADVDRMTSMQREIADSYFELRVLREEAHKENMSSPLHSQPRKFSRPFQRLVMEQADKNKRDKYARERLQKEMKAERLVSERREDNITKAMFPKGQHGQRKKSRSMSGFFTMLRPISAAWSSGKIPMEPRTLEELDFEPTGKPSWVLNLAGAQVQDFVNKQRSFLIRVRTEDGGLYYLQAMDQSDESAWLGKMQDTSSTFAARRLTYQGVKPEPGETGAPGWKPSVKHPNPVYGVPLIQLLEREYGKPPPPDAIPRIVKICIQEIEGRGLTESGIYRLVPASTDLAQLCEAFDSGVALNAPLDPYMDIMTCTSALKAWFRELPECVFTNALYRSLMDAMRDTNFDSKYTRLRELIHMLPPNNFHLLRATFEHLDRVTDFEEQNQMNADNLATCFSQSIIFPPRIGDSKPFPIDLGERHQLVKSLIVQYHWIFEEVEGEQEEEEEDEDSNENAVATDSEDLEGPELPAMSTSRLNMSNMSEDDVDLHGS
ncbi:breakpoint cluster region [Ceratobasidium sp. AG-Ba]|nr:breakpoint cluster region [Ceratobasidium sp. AG-Ba]